MALGAQVDVDEACLAVRVRMNDDDGEWLAKKANDDDVNLGIHGDDGDWSIGWEATHHGENLEAEDVDKEHWTKLSETVMFQTLQRQ